MMNKFVLAALIVPQAASAKVELITNGSFEVNNAADGTKQWAAVAAMPGWTAQSYMPNNSDSNLMYVASNLSIELPGAAEASKEVSPFKHGEPSSCVLYTR